MTLQSMTGFARSSGEADGLSWAWEIRSVNGKGLDVRLRLPAGYEALEVPARKLLTSSFARGNLQVSLQVAQIAGDVMPRVNMAAIEALIEAAKPLREQVGGKMPSVADLMNMKGVVEYEEANLSQTAQEGRNNAIMQSLSDAVASLQEMRAQEGRAVTDILLKHVIKIDTLRKEIDLSDARSPKAIVQQLTLQVEKLLEASSDLDSDRLYQEAVILAAKADLQEELDRLEVHVRSAQEALSGSGPAGRKLDFIAQEFNRECNTICSKSNSAEVTSLGLDMKLAIDQFREQLQNLE